MAKNGWKVADSDMHVMEPADLWQRYIAPEWKHVAPVGLTEMRRDMRMKVKSHVMLRLGQVRPMDQRSSKVWKSSQDDAFGRAEAQGWNARTQIEAMDAEGVDLSVLFPSRGLFVLGLDTPAIMGPDGLEPAFASAIARAYNDWLYDFCQEDPKRLFGAGMIAPHDIEGSVTEIRRCVEKLGFKSVFLAPGCVNRRPWHDRAYDPLWAECERLNTTLSFHGGGQTHLRPDYSLEVLDKLMMWHTFNQPLGMMAVCVSLTAGGVFERFPKLRVGLLEGNCTWAPWLLYRLDEHYEWVGAFEAPELTMKPSEYFRRNCFLSVEADEKTVGHYIDYFGDENLVFSTDYPHADSKFPKSIDEFLELPLAESSKKKILWENWCRLYDFPV